MPSELIGPTHTHSYVLTFVTSYDAVKMLVNRQHTMNWMEPIAITKTIEYESKFRYCPDAKPMNYPVSMHV